MPQVWKNKRYRLQWNQKNEPVISQTHQSAMNQFMCHLRGVRQS